VEDLKGKKQLNRIQAMVLLDMIGDKDLNIVMPGNSNRALVQRVFDAATATGHRGYFSFNEMPIMDDHVPFALAGIPTVNIIDFQFGSAPGLNDYWHTDKDTLDKISPRSMEIIGQTTLRLVNSLRKNPKL
jgi:Zn-dependent M28 family amino/carboxypeptidase